MFSLPSLPIIQSFGVTARPVVAGPSVGVEGNGAYYNANVQRLHRNWSFQPSVHIMYWSVLIRNTTKVGSKWTIQSPGCFEENELLFLWNTYIMYHHIIYNIIIVCTDKNRQNIRTGRRGLWTQKDPCLHHKFATMLWFLLMQFRLHKWPRSAVVSTATAKADLHKLWSQGINALLCIFIYIYQSFSVPTEHRNSNMHYVFADEH